ncbi:hypothetical protein Fleli_3661 [Bernardetia litoralis DSM 6794]|uniref:Uncharacterized protein n=1 Tax=Bernardetia litoralis (strain ATCC 23117 / DSM 6794 / NBRC 15988 / NCIMB 1366 / Fx l1 / Sio-4) TaxID=880071 RepID=I4APU1_BERLS|nr:DUF2281 domain-containing protein [Bernardetia litoralis]AFM05976.1 hypothetical protein Fleli_3661 [Bernardetia litoralis DSM 6794]
MKNITIPEEEYLALKQTINELQEKISLLKDEEFIKKLQRTYQLFVTSTENQTDKEIPHLSIKRGSGKDVIRNMSNDFDAPLDDFKDYM